MSSAGAGADPTGRADAPRFAAYFRVRHYEADALGHVNNAAYLHYLEQAAIEHAAAAGWPSGRLRELGGLFIVRRHEIEYLRPAAPGDVLQVVTWAVEMRGARAMRGYEVHRYGGADLPTGVPIPVDGFLDPSDQPFGELTVRAQTVWAWVDPESGRPRRIPAEVRDAFLAGSIPLA